LVFGFNITIAPSSILSQIELDAKGYGLNHSIANLMNQPSCTLDAINALKYNSQRRALLILVSQQILKPPLGASTTLKIVENRLEMRKLWPPKVKGVKKLKKKNYRDRFLNTQKVHFMCFFAIRIPM
jgi:hypothetical protein